MDGAKAVISLQQQYSECREEKTKTECIIEGIKDYSIDLVKDSALQKILGAKIANYASIVHNTTVYVTECKTAHPTVSCIVGAAAQQTTTAATDFMSGALIVGSPTLPPPMNVAALGTGISGLIYSNQIGKDFGKLAVALVDHLIDNVSPTELKSVDTSKEIIVSDGYISLVFQPPEVKMITQLVSINHKVNAAVAEVSHDNQALEQKIKQTSNKLLGEITRFEQETKLIEVKLGIETNRILDKVRTDYIDAHTSAARHNSSNSNSRAYVRYDNSRWSIGFTYNVGGGGRSGGGGSCIIL